MHSWHPVVGRAIVALAFVFSLAVEAAGQRVIAVRGFVSSLGEPGTIVIEDGQVAGLLPSGAPAPAGAKVIDLGPSGWVLPGLVLADSSVYAPMPADVTAVNPAVRAADAFDPFVPRPLLRASGVTSLYLTPGRNRLMPGCGSVVRVGADPMDAVLSDRAALHVVVTPEAYNPPNLREAAVPPGPDNPPPAPAAQFPRSRAGAFAALRQLLEEARSFKAKTGPGQSALPGAADLSGVVEVLDGKRPLRVRAERAVDILALIEVISGTQIKLVIEGGTEAWQVAEQLAQVNAGVILRAGTPPSGRLPQPAPFESDRGRGHPAAARRLVAAGVRVAFVPARDGGAEDLLWYALDALPGVAGIDAVTSVAADLVGIGDRAGRIAVGRSADLCVFDRDPTTHPEARPVVVVSGGRVIHDLTEGARPIAVLAKRVHTVSGETMEDAIVVVADGKIVAVGKDVVIPNGARRVTADTVIPGLIDAGGQVGIRSLRDAGDAGIQPGAALPAQGMEKRPSDLFDPTFPNVRPLAESGVTTIAVTPSGGQPTSGVLSIMKTSGRVGDESVVRAVGGLLLDYSKARGGADRLVAALKKQLDSGKKYKDSWEKYEKELAKWNKANPDAARKAARERKVGEVSAPPVYDPLTGTWEGTIMGFNIDSKKATLSVRLKEDKAKGTITVEDVLEGQAFEVTVKDDAFKIEATVDGAQHSFKGTLVDDQVSLSWETDDAWQGFGSLRRISGIPVHEEKKSAAEKKGAAAKPEGKGDGRPKKPKTVAASEPYRALLSAQIPVFVGLGDERIAKALVKLLRDEFELTTVVISPSVFPRLSGFLADQGCGYAPPGNPVLRVKGKRVVTTLEAVRKQIPVAMRSGWNGDGRTLYAAAAHAVRCGVRREDALKMVTRWSALILNIADRVGAIEAGLDADLVLLTGRVFEPGTRVQRVMVDGRFVGEEVP